MNAPAQFHPDSGSVPIKPVFIAELKTILSLFVILLLISSLPAEARIQDTLYTGLRKATALYVHQQHIYIVEQGRDRILKLNTRGEVLESIGGKGTGEYEFDRPVDIHATNGLKIFVSDYRNRRVQVFDRWGQYLSSLLAPEDFAYPAFEPSQVSVNALGEVYFMDQRSFSLQWYDLDGNRMGSMPLPSRIKSVDELLVENNRFYILDRKDEVIHILNKNGIYQQFYEASKVLDILWEGGELYRVYPGRLVKDKALSGTSSLNWEPVDSFMDADIDNGYLYLLSSDMLIKLKMPS